MINAEAAILQSEGGKFEDWGVVKNWCYCTFITPLLLLMTHHEETQLDDLPQPYLTLNFKPHLSGVHKCNSAKKN